MRATWVVLLVLSGCYSKEVLTRPPVPVEPGKLRSAAELKVPGDAVATSKAAFDEASKVILHARCLNCHPPDDSPRQRELHEMHDPPVVRGPADHGVVGMECGTCHQDTNLALSRVPGAPEWHLAPLKMAWMGRTASEICNQLKDPNRNGGKTLAQIVDHAGHDKLVGWAWNPGHGREPAPGTQQQFGELIAAWVDNGAACPEEKR